MTTLQIERIKKDLEAARARKDGPETARLFFSLPLSERSEPVIRPGGAVRIVGGSSVWSVAKTSSAGAGWPAISMHQSVFDKIRNVESDGRELAGFLVGREQGDEVEILSFFEAFNETTNTWKSVELDTDYALSRLMDLPLDRSLVGELHTHPTGYGADASVQDLKAAASFAQRFRRQHWVSLICALPESRYALHPDVNAYLIRPDGQHRSVSLTTFGGF